MDMTEPTISTPCPTGDPEVLGRLEELYDALPGELDAQTVRLCSWTPNGGCRSVAVLGCDDAEPLVDDKSRERSLHERAPAVLADLGSDTIESWMLIPLDGSCATNTGDERHLWIGLGSAEAVSVDHLCATRDSARRCLSLEVTATTAARSAPPLARAILDAVPLPMGVVDPRGNLLLTNDNFEFLMGVDSPPPPQTVERRVLPEWQEVFSRAIESTLRRDASVEVPLPPLTGVYEQFDFRLTTSLIEPHRGGPAVVFVIRDVSIGQRAGKS